MLLNLLFELLWLQFRFLGQLILDLYFRTFSAEKLLFPEIPRDDYYSISEECQFV